jgi:hypothetical protein
MAEFADIFCERLASSSKTRDVTSKRENPRSGLEIHADEIEALGRRRPRRLGRAR